MIYPEPQLKDIKLIEDSSPWRESKKGWRVEVVNEGHEENSYKFSVIEAEINKDIEYECASDEDGILLRVCLEGAGTISTAGIEKQYFPNMMMAIQVKRYEKIQCRHTKGRQKFINIKFTESFLKEILKNSRDDLRAGLDEMIFDPNRVEGEKPFKIREFLRQEERQIAESISAPSISGSGSSLWFRAKAMEILSQWAFSDSRERKEFFCSRLKRAVLERIEKAKDYLSENLQNPLDLNLVAKACACSPHYLSRLFAAETGMTLSLYLRKLRVNRACEHLSSGRLNVSEASLEVGYQSLSHFARAFRGVIGVTPSQFTRKI